MDGQSAENGRGFVKSKRLGRPSLLVLNVLLLALVVVEVWPLFTRDDQTEALLSSPNSPGSQASSGWSLLGKGHGDASRVPFTASVAAEALFNATLAHTCWSSEPISTTTSSSNTTEAAAAAPAAVAAGGVVVAGRGCSECVRGEQCSMHVWVRPPAEWVLPFDGSNSSTTATASSSSSMLGGLMAVTQWAVPWGGSVPSSMIGRYSWWKKDLTLSLEGPALGYGEVQCVDPPACSHFLVSYRLWDVGVYRATLHVSCENLNFSSSFAAHFNSTFLHDLATWTLSIGWPDAASENFPDSSHATAGAAGVGGDAAAASDAGDAGSHGGVDAGDGDGSGTDTTSPDTTPPERQVSPCAGSSIPGRWKMADDGNYTWAFFPCAPAESPPDRLIRELWRKGVREINMVGDSHQRQLAVHLHFLLSGDADKRNRGMDFSLESRNQWNETLRINFYWVDGIYRNGEFGCGHRGKFTHHSTTFPTGLSTTADVIILTAGYWAMGRCAEPVRAMRAHLPEYLNWGLQFAARTGKPMVLRTTPPVPSGGFYCAVRTGVLAGPSTNLATMESNRLMRALAAAGGSDGGGIEGGDCGGCKGDHNECGGGGEGGNQEACYTAADTDPAQPWDEASVSRAFTVKGKRLASSIHVFDSWKIEMPRYMDVCPGDHHYSCYVKTPEEKEVVRGPVGEAVARALVHFLIHEL
ncbi:hypothetical protein CLOM_g3053 [Closterium sp. NIES-68]|nr:hypothetical protein CLOM_g3053 [Closterium sp. NIES-68]